MSRAGCPAGITLPPAWPALPGLGEALQSHTCTLCKIWTERSPGLISQWQKVNFVFRGSARRGLTSPIKWGECSAIPSGHEMGGSMAPHSKLPHPTKHRARSATGSQSSLFSCIELGHLAVKFECLKRWMITCEE